MKRYDVISEEYLNKFVDKVNEAIDEGYQLHGPTLITKNQVGGICRYLQAVHKRPNTPTLFEEQQWRK